MKADLQIQIWPVDRLLPYARNARTHSDAQIAQVAASILEFGWTNPILAGADGVVIAGHARLAAARKLGMIEVPVIVLEHLSANQRRALVIADNRIALAAGWDDELLAAELGALREDGFDLDIVGFSDPELDALLGSETEPPEEFREYDETVPTDHECPKCGYKWSGGKTSPPQAVAD